VPIDIQCQLCGSKFHVEDRLAGKRVKCAKCSGVFSIPVTPVMPDGPPGDTKPLLPAPAIKQPSQARGTEQPAVKRQPALVAGNWYLQTQEGDQYGPVSKNDLDNWVAEGRIDAACQVLCEGWEQWKWAEEVYPQLSPATAAARVAPSEDDPLESLGLAQASEPHAAAAPGGIPETVSFRETHHAAASAHRQPHHNLRVAADWLPICAWIALGLGGFATLYSTYEFFNVLNGLGSAAPVALTARVIILFLWWEAFLLLSTFLGFIGLRAMSDWILLRLHKHEEDRAGAELLARVADAVEKTGRSPTA
jgi:predicted Zn finger-like uncharacterized protein